ncbi:MAG: hypothetical protein ACPL06_03595 [Candidatus Anstonellales archaeon]
MQKLKPRPSCSIPLRKYNKASPAYAFPFEEDPRQIIEYRKRLNLERVLTIGSGGGIPLLIFLEVGAKRVDVVDISKNSLALAALRLGAAMDGHHSQFSKFLYTDLSSLLLLAKRIIAFNPMVACTVNKLGFSDDALAELFTTAIKPSDCSFFEYFTEYELPANPEVRFILCDVSWINPKEYTAIFLSNVLTYNLPEMESFIESVSELSTVIYTIAGAPEIFVLSGREFKDRFLFFLHH